MFFKKNVLTKKHSLYHYLSCRTKIVSNKLQKGFSTGV